MRIWLTLTAFVACVAWGSEVETLRVTIDPGVELKGKVLLNEQKDIQPGWTLTSIKNGPDLDLGFNDYIDLRLKLGKGSKGLVFVKYGTDRTPGINTEPSIQLPANLLKRDGQWHVYRLDVALERIWRGTLTDLQVISTASGADLNQVTVGDVPDQGYVPEDANLPVT